MTIKLPAELSAVVHFLHCLPLLRTWHSGTQPENCCVHRRICCLCFHSKSNKLLLTAIRWGLQLNVCIAMNAELFSENSHTCHEVWSQYWLQGDNGTQLTNGIPLIRALMIHSCEPGTKPNMYIASGWIQAPNRREYDYFLSIFASYHKLKNLNFIAAAKKNVSMEFRIPMLIQN